MGEHGNQGEAMSEARELLRIVRNHHPGCDAWECEEADAFLAQPEPAAREAVLKEAVIELLDIVRTVHANKYGSGGFQQEAYRRVIRADNALADTSPATPDGRTRAAALLASLGECICGLPEPAPTQHGFYCPKSGEPIT